MGQLQWGSALGLLPQEEQPPSFLSPGATVCHRHRQPGREGSPWGGGTHTRMAMPLPCPGAHFRPPTLGLLLPHPPPQTLTSKSVVIRTRLEPERNSLMITSRSFWSMSPCCSKRGVLQPPRPPPSTLWVWWSQPAPSLPPCLAAAPPSLHGPEGPLVRCQLLSVTASEANGWRPRQMAGRPHGLYPPPTQKQHHHHSGQRTPAPPAQALGHSPWPTP